MNIEVVPSCLCVHECDFRLGNEICGNILVDDGTESESHTGNQSKIRRKQLMRLQDEPRSRRASFKRARNLFIPVILEPKCAEDVSDGRPWILRNLTYIEGEMISQRKGRNSGIN